MAPDPDARGEHWLDIPLGAVLTTPITDKIDATWVFIGWRQNTAGCEAVFVQAYFADQYCGGWMPNEPWAYHASMRDTLLKKFPGLSEFVKEPA